MALILKEDVADILGIDEDEISDSVYDWAKNEFFLRTDLRESELQRTKRKLFQSSTLYFKLPDSNIKSIDTIKKDGEEETGVTLHENLKFNPDTGLVWYSSGFGAGELCEITYTIDAYEHTEVHNYLLALLVSKSLTLFTPDKVQQVKSVKIGNYSKQFGSASSNLDQYKSNLDMEIDRVVDIILGNDGKLTLERVF